MLCIQSLIVLSNFMICSKSLNSLSMYLQSAYGSLTVSLSDLDLLILCIFVSCMLVVIHMFHINLFGNVKYVLNIKFFLSRLFPWFIFVHRSLIILKFIVMKPVWRFLLIVAEAVISAVKSVFGSSSSQKDQ